MIDACNLIATKFRSFCHDAEATAPSGGHGSGTPAPAKWWVCQLHGFRIFSQASSWMMYCLNYCLMLFNYVQLCTAMHNYVVLCIGFTLLRPCFGNTQSETPV